MSPQRIIRAAPPDNDDDADADADAIAANGFAVIGGFGVPDVQEIATPQRPAKRPRLAPPAAPAYELFYTGVRARLERKPALAAASYPSPLSSPTPSSADVPSLGEGSRPAPPAPRAPPSPPLTDDDADDADDHDGPSVPPDPDDLPPRASAPCGHGLRSTRPITRGTEIVAERAFVTVTYPTSENAVFAAFSELDDDDKIEFLSFSAVAGYEAVFMDIMDTNCIPCTDFDTRDRAGDEAGEGEDEDSYPVGMFRTISRVNHSCRPNAEYRWDEGRRELVLYAIDRIEEGEEITASYLSVLQRETLLPHAKRQALILERIGFECRCAACTHSPHEIKETDAAHTLIREKLERWENMAVQDYVSNSVAETERVIKALEKTRQFAFMDSAYDALFYTQAVWGREAEARHAARLGYAELKVKLGAGADTFPAAQWADDPRTWEDWDLANREPPSSGETRSGGEDPEWEAASDSDSDEDKERRRMRKRLRAKERKDRQRRERYERRSMSWG
ncbi:hypothetical protein Q8F55_000731 [Vanrija albida]|uniref:SET domain-containing protein n=1 Tax=Vanrija albida TaxID=181172 RepID=A0ABR3QEK4_9TREE